MRNYHNGRTTTTSPTFNVPASAGLMLSRPTAGAFLATRDTGGHDSRGSIGMVLGRRHRGGHSRKEQSFMRVLAPAMQNLRPLSALCND